MKDFPVFTTANGVAGLTLQEIPYNRKAYITIHDTGDLPALLQECAGFCKMAGAQEIYACNHLGLSGYPVYTQVLEMERIFPSLPSTDARAVPVTNETQNQFQEIYNRKMAKVPAAKYLTANRMQSLLREGSCYFIYKNDILQGIGIAADGVIYAVASLQPGAGPDLVLTLCKTLLANRVSLEVADSNRKALQLYERLGFAVVDVKNIWYEIY